METVGVKQLRDNLSAILKKVEHGEIVRVCRRGKDIVELRPIHYNFEQEVLDRLKDKHILGGGTGKIGQVRSVKNLKPEMPVSNIVVEDRSLH
ncbi:MAG: hypothetical protein AB1611_12125 [bacterium]